MKNAFFRSLSFSLLLGLCAAFFQAGPAKAQAEPDRRPAIAKAEAYLQSLTTVQARFIQTAPDGRQAAGVFYLSRPGRLRFQYDPPVADFVVADGTFVYFYDGKLGQQSNAPIGQTLADFLLRRDVRLSGDVTVRDVRRNNSGMLFITVAQTADPAAGQLTLGFQENPFQLSKWRVVDSTGAITEVELTELRTGVDLPSSLFVYKAPGAVRRLNP